MFWLTVIIVESVTVIFIGSFARSEDSNAISSIYNNLLLNCFVLLLAFILMYTPLKKFSLLSMCILLAVISISMQMYLLFGTFWNCVFTKFGNSFDITISLLSKGMYASLACLLTTLDFIGVFRYWQVYAITASILCFGFCFAFGIVVYALDVFDGGGGMLVFLYSGLCSLLIWVFCIRGKINIQKLNPQKSQLNGTLGLIGVVLALINWPKFNMAGSLFSFQNVNTLGVLSVEYLMNSAYSNTLLSLCSSLSVSFLFNSIVLNQKISYLMFIDCFANGGIVIASFQDISMDPVSCMVMSLLSSLATIIVHKYFMTSSENRNEGAFKQLMANYSKIIHRIVFSFLGIVIASIVVATRFNRAPELLSGSYSLKAGLQIVAFILVVIIAVIFGSLSALCINYYNSTRKNDQIETQSDNEADDQISDELFFKDLTDEMHPLYYDIFSHVEKKDRQNINLDLINAKMLKQSMIGTKITPLKSNPNNDYNLDQSYPSQRDRKGKISHQKFNQKNENPIQNDSNLSMAPHQYQDSEDLDKIDEPRLNNLQDSPSNKHSGMRNRRNAGSIVPTDSFQIEAREFYRES